MEIRFSNKEDIEGVRKLWEYCFNDSPEYIDFYFEKKFKPSTSLILENNEKIISAIHMNQHSISLNHKKFDLSYIVGVSTLPQARSSGKMRELMKFALMDMYKRGQEVSILMPIDFRLYKKYGYENCYDILLETLKVEDLKKFKISGHFQEAKIAKDLEEVYKYSVSKYNGFAIRDVDYFKDFIDEMQRDGGYIYINYQDSQAQGYIAYSFDGDRMIVRELYYKNIEAYKSLLKFIYNHNTQIKTVQIYSAKNNYLRYLLDNPKSARFEIKDFMMARIINFEKFIKKLDIETYKDFSPFKIAIEDEYIEKNRGIFEFFLEGDKIRVKKVSKLEEIGNFDLFTINELTGLFFGYSKLEDIDFLREKKLNSIIEIRELLESLYPERIINHINEYV